MTKKFTDKIKSKKKTVKPNKKTRSSSKITKTEQERDDLKDKLLRTTAELQNTIRRNQEELEKTHKFAITNFAKDLIPVMESLYSALDHLPKEEVEGHEKFKNFADGIGLTYNELKKVFEKNNLKRIYPLNEKFNPDYHQAIAQIDSDKESGTIVQVMQAGYMINDRLLRPALVGVAKGGGNG